MDKEGKNKTIGKIYQKMLINLERIKKIRNMDGLLNYNLSEWIYNMCEKMNVSESEYYDYVFLNL